MKISMTRDAAYLDERRAKCCAVLDEIAKTTLAKHLTAGEEATYADKEAQARAVLAGSNDAIGFVEDEAARRGVSLAEAASIIVAKADAGREKRRLIDNARLSGKTAIRAATTPDTIEAAALAAQDALQAL